LGRAVEKKPSEQGFGKNTKRAQKAFMINNNTRLVLL
jgi:hypothetical protein